MFAVCKRCFAPRSRISAQRHLSDDAMHWIHALGIRKSAPHVRHRLQEELTSAR
jgi:hypothetical protein